MALVVAFTRYNGAGSLLGKIILSFPVGPSIVPPYSPLDFGGSRPPYFLKRTLSNSQDKSNISNLICPPESDIQYRSTGLIWGRYIPQPDENGFQLKGLIVTEDNQFFPASIRWGYFFKWLEKDDNLEQFHWFRCWTKPDREAGYHFILRNALNPIPENLSGDVFSVRGQIIFNYGGKIAVRINPNRKDPSSKLEKPFKLTFQGILPSEPKNTLGEFWDFMLGREGKTLVVLEARKIKDRLKDRKPKGKGKPSGKPYPLKPKPASQESDSESVASESSASEVATEQSSES
ncbi:hypothetical protein PN466_00650 [Roseofilum reptotaenium CS-1145]|uniref:Uncharacterized protein n=1 Tax=Roseofilum reptotaenium AO1-A TaxID=1925591 RepID=A0A1L9QKA2_9CYAN|nr:hypothetical protein [Roseofilum reptotaenium]MDB9515474.1 hypothetical protein [Roseofilum reptotaenium CS-1145]OJJ16222.1 hypothetical protein BI308_23850 [Roseofilum reptotaenium AO1-A]